MRRLLGWARAGGLGLLVSASSLQAAYWFLSPLRLHELDLELLLLRHGRLEGGQGLSWLLATTSCGAAALRELGTPPPRYEEGEEAWLECVWRRLPRRCDVRPTEGFYYWTCRSGDEVVSGNLRVAELPRGRMTLTFYSEADRSSFRTLELHELPGFQVQEIGPHEFQVSLLGRRRGFRLPEATMPSGEGFVLRPGEELVGRVLDESGVAFVLVFQRSTRSFSFFLDTTAGVPEPTGHLHGELVASPRTGFVYYRDPRLQRLLLVGVHLGHVQANSCFDGPADQVPFWLDLKERLELAYPHTRVGEGIDEHGVMLGRQEWCRVAISPFYRYRDEADMIELFERRHDPAAPPEERWSELTREWWNGEPFRRMVEERLRAEGKS